jgi:hypothetical protein
MMTLKGHLPMTASQESDRPAIIQRQVTALMACGAAYRAAGIDLRAYNTVENAMAGNTQPPRHIEHGQRRWARARRDVAGSIARNPVSTQDAATPFL